MTCTAASCSDCTTCPRRVRPVPQELPIVLLGPEPPEQSDTPVADPWSWVDQLAELSPVALTALAAALGVVSLLAFTAGAFTARFIT